METMEQIGIKDYSSKPKYKVLEDELLSLIKEGKVQVGLQMPTEQRLSDEYKVSRFTVRKAMENLESKGYLERTAGKGTFVKNWRIEQISKRTGRKDIALISIDGNFIQDESWSMRVLHACSSEAENLGYHLTFCGMHQQQLMEGNVPLAIREGTVSGSIIDGYLNQSLMKHLKKFSEDFLLVGMHEDTYGFPSVFQDAEDMTYKITKALISLAHGPVWFVMGMPTIYYMRQLYKGYQKAVYEDKDGLQLLRANLCSPDEAGAVVKQMVSSNHKKHCVVVGSSEHLKVLLKGINNCGLNTEDILFAGIGRYHQGWPLGKDEMIFCETSAEMLSIEAIRQMVALSEKGEKPGGKKFTVNIKNKGNKFCPFEFEWQGNDPGQ